MLVRDDHELIRQGIKRFLSDDTSVHDVGDAANAKVVLSAPERELWFFSA